MQYARDCDQWHGIRPLEECSSAADEDKTLLRLFVVYNVLRGIGFTDARVEECILTGLRAGQGWEEALDWVSCVIYDLSCSLPQMWLHITDEEAKQIQLKRPEERR